MDGNAPCAPAGESMEHHLLKLELATCIGAAGHHAELEVRGPDGDWRADVMASGPDGRTRMAWEAQLSPITPLAGAQAAGGAAAGCRAPARGSAPVGLTRSDARRGRGTLVGDFAGGPRSRGGRGS
ncbi:hypothetical protein ACFXAO_04575 [Streptomyces lavendulae]|uniref:hypothetical protein n=1 Tax=Streptomyces lavendulae TaxID=1914 RepID=UPI0036B3FCC1